MNTEPTLEAVAEPILFEFCLARKRKINNAMQTFNPNCFVEVGPDGVQAKVKALGMYRGAMRPYPHPRFSEV